MPKLPSKGKRAPDSVQRDIPKLNLRRGALAKFTEHSGKHLTRCRQEQPIGAHPANLTAIIGSNDKCDVCSKRSIRVRAQGKTAQPRPSSPGAIRPESFRFFNEDVMLPSGRGPRLIHGSDCIPREH